MIKRRIAFLYTEIAGYFLKCIEVLVKEYDVEVLVIRWPLNAEAPFEIESLPNVTMLERQALSNSDLVKKLREFRPHCLFCSGWADKGYLKAVYFFSRDIPTIIGLDNPWQGSVKQYLMSWLSGRLIKTLFSHIWIPGEPQEKFAEALGFKKPSIIDGFYSADTDYFGDIYRRFRLDKENNFPKRFIYCGRYVKWKGIFELWEAFIQLQKETPNDWELWCLGTGAEFENKTEYPGIKHFGFVQPNQLNSYIGKTGVYILPSHFEPWAVSVHEFAAAGLPLLLSDSVGAAEMFLRENINGASFKPGDPEAIKNAMKNIIQLSDEELNTMGRKSHELAGLITPYIWSSKLMEVSYQCQQ